MFQHWEASSSTTKKVESRRINADPESSKPSVLCKYEGSSKDNWTIEDRSNRYWYERFQETKTSPPSLCTTIDGSWPNNQSCSSFSSPSLTSTLYNDIHIRTGNSGMDYNEQIVTHIAKGNTPRIQIAGFENIHAKQQERNRTEHNGVMIAEHGDPLNDDDDDDEMTLLGDDDDTGHLEFTKQQPLVVEDRRSLLTKVLLQCPPASSTSNGTPPLAHPSIVLVDNDVLSSSLKQHALWENRMNGVLKRSKYNLHDATDGLDTFTGFW